MLDLDELEARAAARLPAHVMGYFRGPRATDVPTESSRWSAVRFRPHALRDTTALSLRTSVLGTPVASPLLIAPMAAQAAAHPDGEAETARAAAALGTLLGVSTNTATLFADVAAAGAPWWFQVYVMDDRSLTEHLVREAAAHGASALILTVDRPAVDSRYPEHEPRSWPGHPMLSNLGPERAAAAIGAGSRGTRSLTVDAVGWLAELSGGLPVIVKGVLRGDDAAACVAAGAAGVIVSTHGGRTLTQVIPAADALPEVVAAVAGRAEVYVDSGLRTAEHVAAALCLGARAVFIGRPVMYALAAGGAPLITELMTGWNADLLRALHQLGVNSLDELGRDLLS